MLDRHGPFLGRLHYSQPDDLHGGIVIREHLVAVGGFPDDTVDRFDGIGLIDDPADLSLIKPLKALRCSIATWTASLLR